MSSTVVRLTPATLTQYLVTQTSLAQPLSGQGQRRAVLLRSEPRWDEPAERAWNGHRVRVAPAPSPLAVHELVLDHLAADDATRVLVVLTDREQVELDPAILARVHKKRINTVDRWDVVREAFGAEQVDPRLSGDGWAGEALLDAAPPGGWPRLPGGMLARRTALTALALRRLWPEHKPQDQDGQQADGAPPAGTGIDSHTLLRWSLEPGAAQRFQALREPEQAGLAGYLGEEEQAGATGAVVSSLVRAGYGEDAVAYGLVCSALWAEGTDGDGSAGRAGSGAADAGGAGSGVATGASGADVSTYRARGRAERLLGEDPPATGEALDVLMTGFGKATREYVESLLVLGDSDAEGARASRQRSVPVLNRASQLVRQFGAESAAALSPVLREGLASRFDEVGRALAEETRPAPDPARATRALTALTAHRLANEPDTRVRIERARMGQRLTRWLAADPAPETANLALGVERQIADTGWVDRALDHIEAGGDPDPALREAYTRLGRRVRQRLHRINHSFARALAAWTDAGTGPGSMLTVESFLERVVGPVATHRGGRRVLLLLLDGMSAAIATELAEQLRRTWAEYDPVPDSAESPPRRRGIAAALPTLTAVSRTSMLAGALTKGTQADERRLFPQHRFWRGAPAAVFHKDELRSQDTGDMFGAGLDEALADERSHVAVVLNTVDDRLAKEQKLGDGSWRLSDIGKLESLLRVAAEQGMAVILTSDHGHVVDRHGAPVRTGAEAGSARHRAPGGEQAETEVALSGPRVVWPEEPGGEIVALWDADSRYTSQKAGYHGGASPAEFVIPVLAFLPFGAAPPKGWRELGDQSPAWWRSWGIEDVPQAPATRPEESAPAKRRRAPRGGTDPNQSALFDESAMPFPAPGSSSSVAAGDPDSGGTVASPAADASAASSSTAARLAAQLMDNELFGAQVGLLARRPTEANMGRIGQAVEILLETGTLPATALAQRVGHPQHRTDGFAAVLRQLLNYDGVQVLETLPDGRTLRLDPALLREQFDLE